MILEKFLPPRKDKIKMHSATSKNLPAGRHSGARPELDFAIGAGDFGIGDRLAQDRLRAEGCFFSSGAAATWPTGGPARALPEANSSSAATKRIVMGKFTRRDMHPTPHGVTLFVPPAPIDRRKVFDNRKTSGLSGWRRSIQGREFPRTPIFETRKRRKTLY